MRIIRTEEQLYNRPCMVFRDDILNYGWEKAIVLGELGQCVTGDGSKMQESELYKRFPFFTKEKFYQILEELIEMGLVGREKGESV